MNTYIEGYILGTKYCRKNWKHGGVTKFVNEMLTFSNIDLAQFCNDHDLEVCAVKLQISSSKIIVLCVYRTPSGNVEYFLNSRTNSQSTMY